MCLMVQQHPHGAGTVHTPEYRMVSLVPFCILAIVVQAFLGAGREPRCVPDHAHRRFIHDPKPNDTLEIEWPRTLRLHQQPCWET
jgi:hypothetical protein